MSTRTTVLVELLDEGTDVWRPVEVVEVRPGWHLLEGSAPDDECWAFPPGTVVECEVRRSSGGERLVATRRIATQG